jgi:hypothetical protein
MSEPVTTPASRSDKGEVCTSRASGSAVEGETVSERALV